MEITLKDMKELFGATVVELPFEVGQQWLIRTVTFAVTGRVKAIKGKFLVLNEAAWIADTGRFGECIEMGSLSEVEAVTADVVVNTDSIVDAYVWRHLLPKETK
jgi:hypothetical protein